MTKTSCVKARIRIACATVLAAFVLSACSNAVTYRPALEMLERYDQVPPRPDKFTYCYGYGCTTAISDAEIGADWASIEALFESAAPTPAEERERIAEAVARFEKLMGARYGTAADIGGTFAGFGRPGQLDCIDETLNTTALLKMLEGQGLLVWHTVSAPVQRGFIIDRWPHVTAVVAERQTDNAYVIDSWFRDNGQRADVVPVEAWLDGWSPV